MNDLQSLFHALRRAEPPANLFDAIARRAPRRNRALLLPRAAAAGIGFLLVHAAVSRHGATEGDGGLELLARAGRMLAADGGVGPLPGRELLSMLSTETTRTER